MSGAAFSLFPAAGFYRGRSVFVTGHTGFKGSWLSLWLAELGAHVHGYSLAPATTPSLFEEANVRERLASHQLADVRDPETLSGAIQKARPEVVFHLAAQPLVRRSYREPRETFETNVMGTVNLLEAVRRQESVRVCQVITSDKCYDNREWPYAYRENDAMGGSDPYSASKGCAELVVAAYRRSYFSSTGQSVSLASARAGNVIGGGDWAEDRIIPDCVRALSSNQPIAVRNPNAVRPWQHVLEPLNGYLQLAARQWQEPGRFSDGWNFGPGPADAVPVRDVVETVLQTWGSGNWIDQSSGANPHEAHTLKLDITKATAALGWRPVHSVREAIALTIGWYRRRHQDTLDLQSLCLSQIRSFVDRLTGGTN